MENLDRGLIALRPGGDSVFLSWRLLGSEAPGTAFNVYKRTGGSEEVKLNASPLKTASCFVDHQVDTSQDNQYVVRMAGAHIVSNQRIEKVFTLKKGPPRNYLNVPLQTPLGYVPNDASVGDLDGDGSYEIVLHQAGRGRDNSQDGVTDPPILQAYKTDGTLMWTIKLGKNIREGAHYTQFMVYDLDGDGKAEVACKTADGTIDGKGKVIGDSTKHWINAAGRILDGPEYFTIFSGETGAALATTAYLPGRGDVSAWGGKGGNARNDHIGNRADRFLACVAYLDGHRPSVVMCRGYYGRTVLAAWDWRDHKLSSRWVFDSDKEGPRYAGQGNHNLAVADVDGDGKDDIIYGSMCVGSNGKGIYSTDLRHGDAVHVSQFNPNILGQQVFGIHEFPVNNTGVGSALFDARTGKMLWIGDHNRDVGRGMVADIDPRYPGAEMWCGTEGLRSFDGRQIGACPRSVNFAIWWDGDLLRELLDKNRISKWDWNQQKETPLFVASGCSSNNGSKATPVISCDLLGDWREEVIFRTDDNQNLRIYSTVTPTKYRFYTLMHDAQYRLAIAWQNVGYNQPPYTSYYLGEGMNLLQKKPDITLAGMEKRKDQ